MPTVVLCLKEEEKKKKAAAFDPFLKITKQKPKFIFEESNQYKGIYEYTHRVEAQKVYEALAICCLEISSIQISPEFNSLVLESAKAKHPKADIILFYLKNGWCRTSLPGWIVLDPNHQKLAGREFIPGCSLDQWLQTMIQKDYHVSICDKWD